MHRLRQRINELYGEKEKVSHSSNFAVKTKSKEKDYKDSAIKVRNILRNFYG